MFGNWWKSGSKIQIEKRIEKWPKCQEVQKIGNSLKWPRNVPKMTISDKNMEPYLKSLKNCKKFECQKLTKSSLICLENWTQNGPKLKKLFSWGFEICIFDVNYPVCWSLAEVINAYFRHFLGSCFSVRFWEGTEPEKEQWHWQANDERMLGRLESSASDSIYISTLKWACTWREPFLEATDHFMAIFGHIS